MPWIWKATAWICLWMWWFSDCLLFTTGPKANQNPSFTLFSDLRVPANQNNDFPHIQRKSPFSCVSLWRLDRKTSLANGNHSGFHVRQQVSPLYDFFLSLGFILHFCVGPFPLLEFFCLFFNYSPPPPPITFVMVCPKGYSLGWNRNSAFTTHRAIIKGVALY